MEFNDAVLLRRQWFCVVEFYHRSIDLQLFVFMVFAHRRRTGGNGAENAVATPPQGKIPSKGRPQHKGGSYTDGGASLRQRLSIIP